VRFNVPQLLAQKPNRVQSNLTRWDAIKSGSFGSRALPLYLCWETVTVGACLCRILLSQYSIELVLCARSEPKGGGLQSGNTPPPNSQNRNLKKHRFCRYHDINIVRDLPFTQNQPLKSADDKYIIILKNKLIKLKKQEDRTLWLSHGTCSYIRMYINAVAGSVKLCLQHDFYNIIFKIKHKLYIASGSAPPPPPEEKFSMRTRFPRAPTYKQLFWIN
jgi:hypothetical protein